MRLISGCSYCALPSRFSLHRVWESHACGAASTRLPPTEGPKSGRMAASVNLEFISNADQIVQLWPDGSLRWGFRQV